MNRTIRTSGMITKTILGVAIAGSMMVGASTAEARSGGLFDLLFGGPRVSQPIRPVAAPAAVDMELFAPAPKPAAKKPRRAAPSGDGIYGKAMPAPEVAAFNDPDMKILHDPSLRRGDVVVFAAGVKVFVGKGRKGPWTMADFEDVATTKALGAAAREQVVAMTANNNAGPDLVIEASIVPPDARQLKLASVDPTPVN